MGIQINGQTDTIAAVDGSLTVSGANLPTVTNLNATGVVTATGFVGNITGNINATGISTFFNGILVGTGTSISSPSSNTLAFGTNNAERVRVSAGGVSIGSIATYGDSNASFTSLSLGGNGTRYGLLEIKQSNGVAGSWIDSYGTNGNGDLRITTAGTSNNITFWTGGAFTEKVRITAGGNVGIATTIPVTKLHIHNSDYGGNLTGSTGFELSSVDATGTSWNVTQREGFRWIQYHGSAVSWIGKGNYGWVWNDGVNASTGLSAGITTAGYIVGNRNIIQVIDSTSATRVNGAGSFTAITSGTIKCTTDRSRFMIQVTCPVNLSDDSDASNNSTSNPYFYGIVQRNLNGGGWTDCGGKGSTSQGGVNAHIELSPNRTGTNGSSDYWSGNRYRMEHKYAHFFDDELSSTTINSTIQFRLQVVYYGGDNWIQIGEPHGFGADDNYPCQRWGMMIYEIGPETPFQVVNKRP